MALKQQAKLYRGLIGLILAGLLAACGETTTPAANLPSPSASTTAVGAATAASPAPAPTGTVAVSVTPASTDVPFIGPSQANARPFQPAWQVTLEDATAPLMVGESDGLVFVRTLAGGLYALNAQTGALAWKHPAPPQTGPAPTTGPYAWAGQGLAVIGDTDAGRLVAYEARTGRRKWEASLKFDAPGRDPGGRFLGGRLYENTLVVAVSSKRDPFSQQAQTPNPEYVLVAGLDLATGKEAWSAVTDPPPAGTPIRPGNVIFGSKLALVESPDGQVGAIEGATGKRRWRTLNLFLLRDRNPDRLYSLPPEGQTEHNPRLRKHDPDTANLLWEKVLPIKVREDPPIFVAPDERTAYMIAIVSDKESYMFGFDLETVKPLWRHATGTYGPYTLVPTNSGVRLRNFGKVSGIVYFKREDPSTPLWLAGGLELGDEIETPEGLYLTAKLDTGGALFLVDLSNGDIRYTIRTGLAAGPPLAGNGLIYLPATDPNGKAVVAAFVRPA